MLLTVSVMRIQYETFKENNPAAAVEHDWRELDCSIRLYSGKLHMNIYS